MSDKNLEVPEGLRGATPMLAIRNAAKAIEFYKEAFGVREVMRFSYPDGKVAHAEIALASGAIVMIAEEDLRYNASPESLGGSPVIMNIYFDDPDAVVARAVKAGAKAIFPVKDQFYGDRSGRIQDPFGHLWIISKVIEKVSMEEMQKRWKEMCG